MRVAIIGLGVIGTAQAAMFADHDVITYDPARDDTYPADEIAGCDFAVVCVGTPEGPDGHADLSYVEAACAALPEGLPAVLRSTVPPGTTDRLLGAHGDSCECGGTGQIEMGDPLDSTAPTWMEPCQFGRLYCHAPEFMGENVLHSWQRSTDVPYMIIGGPPEAAQFFHERFARVFPGTIHTCSAKESELAKYAANLYWAARVTFVNEFALVCQQFGVDYENVRAAWLSDPRMTSVYTKRAGYPAGFDGRCWPKDLAALTAASVAAGYEPGFLRSIAAANGRFRGEDNL